MNTIVVNTLSGAVSEYAGFGFQSITPTHAGSATGLFELVGDTDDGLPIAARVQTGKPAWESSLRKSIDTVFFGLKGSGNYRLHVSGENADYVYRFSATPSGEARAKPGRGISETYMSFGFSNPDGQPFEIDTIEVLVGISATRRV